MIKINGPKYYQGSGDYYIFGYLGYGNGIGEGIRSQYLFCSSTGNGWGDGYVFGDIKGSGNSYYSYKLLKKEFKK